MTHPALDSLTLDELRARGADARRLGLPDLSNPLLRDQSLSLERFVARGGAWSAGWLVEDAGRTESVQRHLRAELSWRFG